MPTTNSYIEVLFGGVCFALYPLWLYIMFPLKFQFQNKTLCYFFEAKIIKLKWVSLYFEKIKIIFSAIKGY